MTTTPVPTSVPVPTGSRSRTVATLAAVIAAAMVLIAVTHGHSTAGHGTTAAPARSTADTFFTRYLAADGRIVRLDQGSDTVSEGQAYGMLAAVGTGDAHRFALIWGWTQTHLQRPDRLLAWHWARGAVVDATPASDADLDAAVALLQAGDRFDNPGYRTAGTAIANAVLSYETIASAPGALVAAGPWGVARPAVVNPSYVVSGTALWLAHETGNTAWNAVATATAALDTHLATAYRLPPDWTSVRSDAAAAVATGAPDGSTRAQYGLDAIRLVIRLAASCSPEDRRLAAAYAGRLGGTGAAGARSLTGAATVSWHNAATDVALYAARSAAGDTAAAAAALRSAQAQQQSYPTYYGMAWLALAPLMFGPHLSETCS